MFVLPARMPRKRAASRKAPTHHEHSLQEAVATYLARILAPPAFFTSIGHGGFSLGKTPDEAKIRGARMKRAGLRAGIPDIMILHNGRSFFVELKSATGSLSENQKIVHQLIAAAGAGVTVCRSVEDVRDRLEVWGVPTLESRLPPAERAVLFAQYRAS